MGPDADFKKVDAGYQKDQTRDQQPSVPGNTFCLQHPSSTTVTNIDVAEFMIKIAFISYQNDRETIRMTSIDALNYEKQSF